MRNYFGLVVIFLGATAIPVSAQIIFTPNVSIIDPLVTGLTDTRTITTHITSIGDLNVGLVITGDPIASNGDFYATLTHGTGFAILLNRIGRQSGAPDGFPFGYPDNGLSITLDDQASNGDIHNYRLSLFGNHSTPVDVNYENPLTGSWVADGREAPYSSVSYSSPRSATPLKAFNGLDPNGTWTLFIADVSLGGSSTLVSWSLDITAVPEPAEAAVVASLLILSGALFLRIRRKQDSTKAA